MENKRNTKKTSAMPSIPRAQRRQLRASAQRASLRAQRISKALGLPVQSIRDGELIEECANGEIKNIRSIGKVESKIQIKKGTTLCLNKKD